MYWVCRYGHHVRDVLLKWEYEQQLSRIFLHLNVISMLVFRYISVIMCCWNIIYLNRYVSSMFILHYLSSFIIGDVLHLLPLGPPVLEPDLHLLLGHAQVAGGNTRIR